MKSVWGASCCAGLKIRIHRLQNRKFFGLLHHLDFHTMVDWSKNPAQTSHTWGNKSRIYKLQASKKFPKASFDITSRFKAKWLRGSFRHPRLLWPGSWCAPPGHVKRVFVNSRSLKHPLLYDCNLCHIQIPYILINYYIALIVESLCSPWCNLQTQEACYAKEGRCGCLLRSLPRMFPASLAGLRKTCVSAICFTLNP